MAVFLVLALVAVLGLTVAAESRGVDIPEATVVGYQRPDGAGGVYLLQAPTNPSPDAAVIIYMHGAKKDETQGMSLFPILRQEIAEKGWIYVSPRAYEYEGLVADLTMRFGRRRLYLAGASAGARVSFEEICRIPRAYAGQFLIGPALRRRRPVEGRVTVPTFIIYGDLDGRNTESAQLVAEELRRQKVPVREVVVKGEGHDAPYGRQDWWYEALTFVTGEEFNAP